MRISRVRGAPPNRPQSGKAKPAADGGGFARTLGTQESDAPAASGGGAQLNSVSALLALQEVPDPIGQRRRAEQRAADLLDHLEALRRGLLEGQFSKARLDALRELLAARREAVEDPRLAQILADIELRAAVELAKLQG